MRRIVRPHLHTGDALLFDCRILHFGLANETPSSSLSPEQAMVKRPIVYVNYHHRWFNDPKNWNDNERLFGE
jgi:ectoine hydroxylase-related dioxygenase (phytanoyl-CoA dioxygenase family)